MKAPSVADFRARFERPQRPVVITGALSGWTAAERWTPEHLARVHGDHLVEVRASPIDEPQLYRGDPLRSFRRQRIALSDCLARIFDPASRERIYLQYCDLEIDLPRLRGDVVQPPYCPRWLLSNPALWVCGGGTVNPLHYDFNNALMAGVVGEKRYVLFPPDDSAKISSRSGRLLWRTTLLDLTEPNYAEFPGLSETTPYECTLRPGELLFIPYRWWHFMETSVFSISVSWWWEPSVFTRAKDAAWMRLLKPVKSAVRWQREARERWRST